MIEHLRAWILLGLTVGCSIYTILWGHKRFGREAEP